MDEETKLVHLGRDPHANHGIINMPVYHASTVLAETYAERQDRRRRRETGERVITYGVSGTPSSVAFEETVAQIEGGAGCHVFPSGLAALAVALLSYLKAGDHLLMTDSAYAPTRKLCNSLLARNGIETTFYDPLIGGGIAEMMRPNTRVVFTESPGSQTFEVQDIPAIAEAAHKQDAVVMIDNTWASPLYFKPFEHGCDVSIQAATKYIAGHSDLVMGTVTANAKHLQALHDMTQEMGQCCGPDDVYLAARGMRTMAIRLKRHWESGLEVAEWLKSQPGVRRVIHPALPGDANYALWKRDFLGASGLFSIVTEPCSDAALAAFVDNMGLFGIGASWGGFESLILPNPLTGLRTATTWDEPGHLVRLNIGLEHPDDLKADLAAGLKRMKDAA